MDDVCLDGFTCAYIEALEFVKEGDFYLNSRDMDSIERDCRIFQTRAAKYLIGLDPLQCGHDFYLTRNGHGSGFWDRGYDKTIADELCRISKEFGESDEGTQLGAKQ